MEIAGASTTVLILLVLGLLGHQLSIIATNRKRHVQRMKERENFYREIDSGH